MRRQPASPRRSARWSRFTGRPCCCDFTRICRFRRLANSSERLCLLWLPGFAVDWSACGWSGKEAPMAIDPHQRARLLLEGARLSGIAPRDELWLRTHVAVCVDCARYGEELEGVVRGLRSFAFDVDPALSERIQLAIGA